MGNDSDGKLRGRHLQAPQGSRAEAWQDLREAQPWEGRKGREFRAQGFKGFRDLGISC